MANITKQKRDQMIAFLEELKKAKHEDSYVKAFNEIENHIKDKKFGLVFEEHEEAVDVKLRTDIPVFCEDSSRKIKKDESMPWNFLIEGDNLQALYLLEKTHKGKVSCIYIDPPYNTGAKDWKYNNDYVESTDLYRHSKWLSMMNVRLRLAKKLLNPETGILIVTIDEHEVHNLRALLDELFPEAYIQMVTIVINPKGSTRGYFSRVEEYAIYCFMPKAKMNFGDDSMLGEIKETKIPRWKGLLRSGEGARREDSKNLFYPILIDSVNKRIVKAGDVLPYPIKPNYGEKIEGYDVAWPIRNDMSEGRWMLSVDTFNSMLKKGYISLGRYDKKRGTWGISYLSKKPQKQIETGELVVLGRDKITGTVIVEYADAKERQTKTVWHRTLHDAGAYGSDLVSEIIGSSRAFSFPKSLYAVRDSLSVAIKNNSNAIVLDFFAGSGTTLHALNLLNEEDNGNRTCILVTNNELSAENEEVLGKQGYKKGDDKWESLGIARAVTYPRIKYSINGCRDDGSILEGEYFTKKARIEYNDRKITIIDYFNNFMMLKLNQKKDFISLVSGGILPKNLVKKDTRFIVSDNEKHTISILLDDSAFDEWINAIEEQEHLINFVIISQNKDLHARLKQTIEAKFDKIEQRIFEKKAMSEGFKCNVKYLKCDWTPRKPEDYLLSNALCLHIKEMIELQNAIEVDGEKNVLLLNRDDIKRNILDPVMYEKAENIWLNQNIILNAEEIKLLDKKGFKYIPREFFGQELREAAE